MSLSLASLAGWATCALVAGFVSLCLARIDYRQLLSENDGSASAVSRAPMLAVSLLIAARHLILVLADPRHVFAPVTPFELWLLAGGNLAYVADKGARLNGNRPPLAAAYNHIFGGE